MRGQMMLNWKFFEFEIRSLLVQDSNDRLAYIQRRIGELPWFHRDRTNNRTIVVHH